MSLHSCGLKTKKLFVTPRCVSDPDVQSLNETLLYFHFHLWELTLLEDHIQTILMS